MTHELDFRPQVEFLRLPRQNRLVLERPGSRKHRSKKILASRPKHLSKQDETAVLSAPTEKLVKDYRRDVARQSPPLVLLQRHKQPIRDSELHGTREVYREMLRERCWLAPVPERLASQHFKPLEEVALPLEVRSRWWRYTPKLALAVRHETSLSKIKKLQSLP